MKVDYRKPFKRDLKKIKDKSAKYRIKKALINIENAKSIIDIPNLRNILSEKGFFRIRAGEYRIGLKIENDLAIVLRVLPRKDFYKSFP